ncbi:hypothetical protein [Yonghaparkia sp. Soil809]|uniref:hypothetical protein n=1 Tax=Yonghaparkia sp. Soil809 TaxID=1736417 RepID=UPI0006F58B99|nr:hypothetical protein [Yonghaparkia sp. Soil809]KRF31119.1 hypothetical protein ASG83_09875 [Yonghaparkia sp. Soil809]
MYSPDFGLMTGLLLPVILAVVSTAITLLLLYGIIRVGVSRGMRDYHRWAQNQPPRGGATGYYGPITPQRPAPPHTDPPRTDPQSPAA